MTTNQSKKGLGAAARITALAGSVMDLHVRIALQEMDREKRRLISGGIFLATGGILMILAMILFEILLSFEMINRFDLSIETTVLCIAIFNIVLAGISLRIGGLLAKGPYLPETIEGLNKTTRAVLGKVN